MTGVGRGAPGVGQVPGIHQPVCPGIREPRIANHKPQADSFYDCRILVLSRNHEIWDQLEQI